MLPDFTQQIGLDGGADKTYRFLRLLVYISSLSAGAYLFTLIFFPSQDFQFRFSDPTSTKNTISGTRNQSDILPHKGIINPGDTLYFNTEMREKYSEVIIEIEMEKSQSDATSGEVKLRKAYQSLLYPDGPPVGFKEGSLLKNGDRHYIVSGDELRPLSLSLIEKLGFSREAFLEISAEDLKHDQQGEVIADNGKYPQSTLFQVENAFFIMDKEKLRPFSSANAYLSHYPAELAIQKDPAFLETMEVLENPVGFADGSLVSFDVSVLIVDQNKLLPINNPITFESKGFDWKDVVPIGSDEMALYEKQKLFNITSPHPDGIIFSDEKAEIYYMIENGIKRKIPSKNILKSWTRRSPILFSSEALDVFRSCRFAKEKLSFENTIICSASIKDLENFPGTGFEFQSTFDSKININDIDVTFNKEFSYANFKSSASYFLNSIKNRYAPAR